MIVTVKHEPTASHKGNTRTSEKSLSVGGSALKKIISNEVVLRKSLLSLKNLQEEDYCMDVDLFQSPWPASQSVAGPLTHALNLRSLPHAVD